MVAKASHLGNWHTVLTGSGAKVAQMMLMDVAEALAISPKNEGGPTGRSNNQSIGKSVCWFQLLQCTDAGHYLGLQPCTFPVQGPPLRDWEYIVDEVHPTLVPMREGAKKQTC